MTWKFGWSSTREPDYPYQWRAAPLHDITIFFDKGKQLILSKWTNHKSAFPGKSSLSSREQDRQGDDTKTLCLFHFPFLWGILEVLVKLYCNGVMIQVSTWCFSTALLCPPVPSCVCLVGRALILHLCCSLDIHWRQSARLCLRPALSSLLCHFFSSFTSAYHTLCFLTLHIVFLFLFAHLFFSFHLGPEGQSLQISHCCQMLSCRGFSMTLLGFELGLCR